MGRVPLGQLGGYICGSCQPCYGFAEIICYIIDIYKYAEEDEYTKLAREYSSWNDHHGDLDECYHGDKIRCYAYIMDGGFCLRANTLLTYCEANRQVCNQSLCIDKITRMKMKYTVCMVCLFISVSIEL